MSAGLDRTTRLTVGVAGVTRAATGGMLATALAVSVGRRGSPLAVGLLGSVFFLSMMVFAPLWGSLGDALGRRRAVLVGLSSLSALVTIGFVAVRSVPGVISLRFLYGVFAVGVSPILLTSVSALGGRTHRGRSVGFFNSSLAAGDVAGQLLVGVLLGVLSPSGLYAVIAGAGVLATVAVARLPEADAERWSPERATDGSAASAQSVTAVVAGVRTRLLPPASERAVLREQGLTWLYAGLFVRHAAVKGVGSLVPIYLLSVLGVSTVTMGALLTVGSAAQLGFMPASGRLADSGPRRRLVVGGIAASGVYTLVLATAPTFASDALRTATAGAGFVLLAAGFSAMDVGVVSLLGDAAPERETTLVGLRATATGAGGVVGPLLVGVAAATVGYQVGFALAGLLAFAGAGLVARTLEEPDRPTAVSSADRTVETAVGIPRPIRADDADD